MPNALAGFLGLAVIVAGTAAVVQQRREVRAARRRQARNLSLALAALQRHRWLMRQPPSRVA
jgi:hypothetical protein